MSVRVMVCRVGAPPVVELWESDPDGGHLDRLQAAVGGTVTVVGLDDGVDLWCNDDGILLGLPLNRRIPARAPEVPEGWEVINLGEGLAAPGEMGEWRIHGDFVLARVDSEGGLADVTDADVARYTEMFGR